MFPSCKATKKIYNNCNWLLLEEDLINRDLNTGFRPMNKITFWCPTSNGNTEAR